MISLIPQTSQVQESSMAGLGCSCSSLGGTRGLGACSLVEDEEPEDEEDDSQVDEGEEDDEEDGKGLVGDPEQANFGEAAVRSWDRGQTIRHGYLIFIESNKPPISFECKKQNCLRLHHLINLQSSIDFYPSSTPLINIKHIPPPKSHPSFLWFIFFYIFSSPSIALNRLSKSSSSCCLIQCSTSIESLWILTYNTTSSVMKKITFGTRELNQLLDDTLMKKHLFPSETLMEIAGLAVAQVAHLILRRDSGQQQGQQQKQSICVLVGPGNNGGDGLVAARHLRMMNYIVDLVVFKQLEGKNGIYHQLCTLNDIPSRTPTSFLSEKNSPAPLFRHHLQESTLIIDSVFGFPFTGEMRQPYREFIHELKDFEGKILSVDIPSGWDANEGNIHNLFTPRYLISLGLPKKCSEDFKGQHYFGGRFIPESVRKQLDIDLPDFQGDSLYCRL